MITLFSLGREINEETEDKLTHPSWWWFLQTHYFW